MRGQNSVLVGRRRPAHQLEGAQIGANEAQPSHPGGDIAPRHEESFAGLGVALQVETNAQHHHEIDRDDGEVHRVHAEESLGAGRAGKEPGEGKARGHAESPQDYLGLYM